MQPQILECDLILKAQHIEAIKNIWLATKLKLPHSYEAPSNWWSEDRSGLNLSIYKTLPKMLEALGFEFTEANGDIEVFSFNGSWAYEHQLFGKISHLIDIGSYVFWSLGEDTRAWVFDGTELHLFSSIKEANTCLQAYLDKNELEEKLSLDNGLNVSIDKGVNKV